jgi:hypothetical protein
LIVDSLTCAVRLESPSPFELAIQHSNSFHAPIHRPFASPA